MSDNKEILIDKYIMINVLTVIVTLIVTLISVNSYPYEY